MLRRISTLIALPGATRLTLNSMRGAPSCAEAGIGAHSIDSVAQRMISVRASESQCTSRSDLWTRMNTECTDQIRSVFIYVHPCPFLTGVTTGQAGVPPIVHVMHPGLPG